MEAILLAGGLGTRLHAVTGDRYPKCLATVAEVPFIHYMINYLSGMGVTRFVMAVSHHADQVKESLESAFPEMDICYSYEDQPLGTGGAIKQALSQCEGDKVLVINADSFMEFNLAHLLDFAIQHQASLAMVCTEVDDVSRFGAADIAESGLLRGFFEKGRQGSGYINAGIYLIDRCHPQLQRLSGKFSFENEVLANPGSQVYAQQLRGLFFDIGTPDDYAGAQALVKLNPSLFESQPNG